MENFNKNIYINNNYFLKKKNEKEIIYRIKKKLLLYQPWWFRKKKGYIKYRHINRIKYYNVTPLAHNGCRLPKPRRL